MYVIFQQMLTYSCYPNYKQITLDSWSVTVTQLTTRSSLKSLTFSLVYSTAVDGRLNK